MSWRVLGLRQAISAAAGLLLASGAIISTSSCALADDVLVFAAASLKNALDDVANAWTTTHGGKVTASLAGSPALAKQIEHGAPADVFISADQKWMDALATAGHIVSGTRRDLLSNSIVLIAHGKDAKPVAITKGFDLSGLLKDGRLAMAMVDSVPAGVYGKASLTSLGVWDSVADKVAQSANVRIALTLVARGEAPYGIVYATDASASDNVTIVDRFPSDSHPPIVYPAAVTTGTKDRKAALAFLDFLSSETAAPLFARHGFRVMAKAGTN